MNQIEAEVLLSLHQEAQKLGKSVIQFIFEPGNQNVFSNAVLPPARGF